MHSPCWGGTCPYPHQGGRCPSPCAHPHPAVLSAAPGPFFHPAHPSGADIRSWNEGTYLLEGQRDTMPPPWGLGRARRRMQPLCPCSFTVPVAPAAPTGTRQSPRGSEPRVRGTAPGTRRCPPGVPHEEGGCLAEGVRAGCPQGCSGKASVEAKGARCCPKNSIPALGGSGALPPRGACCPRGCPVFWNNPRALRGGEGRAGRRWEHP